MATSPAGAARHVRARSISHLSSSARLSSSPFSPTCSIWNTLTAPSATMSTESSHPPRPEAAMAPISRSHRPSTAGPADEIEKPFPLKMEGKVEKGFGRGSRELGIPTGK